MFRAISCSSSGGQIVLIQHLASSLSVSDRPVHRLRKTFFLNLCTGRSLTESDDTRCYINTIWPPEDEQDIARNMYMSVRYTGWERTSFSTRAPDGHLLRVTIPDAVLIQFDLLRMSKILLETCTCPSGVQVEKELLSQPVHGTVTYWEWRYQMLY